MWFGCPAPAAGWYLYARGPLAHTLRTAGWGCGDKYLSPPPRPPVQTTVNDQKLTEPTPSVAWTRALLTRHCAVYMRKHMAYDSENQGAKCATKAIMPQSAAMTQNMNITPLKPKVSDSRHGTQ